MEEDKEEGSKNNSGRQDNTLETVASLFTEDLVLEVLSRLPARSVRRFKCVSTPWRDLIADPVHRKKLPQTLAGFLYTTCKSPFPGDAWSHHFASVSGSAAPFDPSLPFLQPNKDTCIFSHVDTCNGLILCARYSTETLATDHKDEFRYVVCNPATKRWIELPPPPQAQLYRFRSTTRLAFDPAVSSHFHVLEFVETFQDVGCYFTAVDIFSSQTGAWIRRDAGLAEKITVPDGAGSVFFGGMLHLICELGVYAGNIDKEYVLLVVDMEGEAWKTISLPVGSSHGTIGLSQGCLCYASSTLALLKNCNTKNYVLEITLWCLENYDNKEWVLKHSAIIDEPLMSASVFAIHPHCSTVFWVPLGGARLVSYDLQHHKFVHNLNLEKGSHQRYLPYVPLFSEALADADGQ